MRDHDAVDLELTIRPSGEGSVADARLADPGSQGDARLAVDVPVALDPNALLAHSLDPVAYGRTLTAQVFADLRLRDAWRDARRVADGANLPLRLRLRLTTRTAGIHALRWETLRDPITDVPLATDARLLLVRSLDTDDTRPIRLGPKPSLSALFVVANPSDLSRYGMAEINVAGEVGRVQAALGDIALTVIGDVRRATLGAIQDALRASPTILCLMCHGKHTGDDTNLWLENDDGTTAHVTGSVLTQILSQSDRPPLLVILIACEGGGKSHHDGPLAALGPRLAHTGVGAVLAMQDTLLISTATRLLPVLFEELARDGRIDRAVALARAALRERSEWWVPALWLRMRDGRLWHDQDVPPEDDPPFITAPGLYPPCPRRVGQDAIAADLRTRLQAATTRHASIVRLESPPGYGKHALVRELANACTALGGVVMGMTFEPLPHAADSEPPVTVAVPAHLPAQVAAHWPQGKAFGSHWCHLMAQAQVALQRSRTPGIIAGMGETPEALLSILRQVSYSGLVVLLLEHWERAGPAWELLLGQLVASVERNPMRLLVVLTYDRAGIVPVTTDRTVLDTAIATGTVGRHILSRVTADDLAAVVGPAQRDLLTRLYTLSAGHPALALTMWDVWVATEAVIRDNAGIWQPTSDDALWVEDSMRELARKLVRIRLGTNSPLPPETVSHMLAVAALEGPVFTAQAVADALGVDTDDLLDTCDDYLLNEDPDASVVFEVGPLIMNTRLDRYRFALPYLHLVFARELRGAARTDAALALAVALERRYQPAPEHVFDVLVTLFTLGGDPARAETYRIQRERHNHEHVNEFMLRWTITMLRQQGHAGTWQMCDAYRELAGWLYDHGRYAEGVPEAKAACVIAEALDDPIRIATSLNNLALLFHAVGDYPAARPLFEQALAIREEALGPRHPDTASSLNNLAGLLVSVGDYAAASPLYERALAIREQALGPIHPDTASSLNNLAGLFSFVGDDAAARPLFERALAIREQALGPIHPDTASSLNNLAGLLEAVGDYPAARPLFERAIAIREQALGPRHPDTASSLHHMAGLLRAVGDDAAARLLYERAIAIREQALGPRHPDTASSLNNLAGLLSSVGDYAAARLLSERAIAIREQALGPRHPDTAQSLNNLAALFHAMGDYPAARPLYERALAIREQTLGPRHPDTASSLDNLAALLHAVGDYAAARPLFERALAIYEQALGPRHPDTATSLNELAGLFKSVGDYAAARPLYERAIAIYEQALGSSHPSTATSLYNLAGLLRAVGDDAEARPLYERALAIWEQALGTDHPYTQRSRQRLADIEQRLAENEGQSP